LETPASVVRGDFNQIRPLVSNHHTRKTFLAKALGALAGLGLLGGTRLAAKPATGSTSTTSESASSSGRGLVVQADSRAVARSVDSL
jgi:hypothetical protein